MQIVIEFKSPYIYLCPECEIWWKGLGEFQKEPNPHYGHSILVFNTEKEPLQSSEKEPDPKRRTD